MGKLGQGLLGATNGRVGPVVFAKWKSLTVVRIRPRRSRRTGTLLQLDQRNKLRLLSTFFSRLLGLLNVSFRTNKKDMSVHNAAMSFNLKRAVFIDAGSNVLDYSKIQISRGDLFGVSGLRAAIFDEGVLQLSWNDDSEGWCSSALEDREQDALTVVLAYRNKYNKEEFQYFENMVERVKLSLSLKLPRDIQQASLVHCWIYFASADSKQVSQSQYCVFSVLPIQPV